MIINFIIQVFLLKYNFLECCEPASTYSTSAYHNFIKTILANNPNTNNSGPKLTTIAVIECLGNYTYSLAGLSFGTHQ